MTSTITEATLIPSAQLIDLTQYDVILISTSAGKDSQTMLRHIHTLATQQGVVDRLVAVHADLGRVDWEGTVDLAREQCEHYGIRFEIVKRFEGILEETLKRKKWPSPAQRWCTSHHKRDQIHKLMTALANEFHGNTRGKVDKPVRILNCMGMRAEESAARAKRCKEPLRANKGASNGRRTVTDWLPLSNVTEGEVWDDIKRSGVRYHWAYDKGMGRLSCCFCIFAPRNALLIAGEHNPELLAEYAAVEKEIDFSFRKELPIVEIVDALQAGERGEARCDGCEWNM